MSKDTSTVLEIHGLAKTYTIPKAFQKPLEVKALRGVSLQLKAGETLAVVGESGCGKSTLAKVLMRIEERTQGSVSVLGRDIQSLGHKDLPSYLQMIFQDPYSSINPRKTIFDIIAEPLKIRNVPVEEIRIKVEATAARVGLRPELLKRYPHMLSGGQRQRVGIARALTTEPKVIVCDEPVSALDVSVQAQVLNLLLDLQKEKGLSYLFISHDLGVVRFLAHRVAVMYLGQFVEVADADVLFKNPKHPYTQLLLQSTPSIGDGQVKSDIQFQASDLPSPLRPPSGCGFHTRCPFAQEQCKSQVPELRKLGETVVACHLAQ